MEINRTPTNSTDGGEGVAVDSSRKTLRTDPPSKEDSTPRPHATRGAWAGVCDAQALGSSEERKRLRRAAVDAGFIEDTSIDLVRFLATCWDARQRPAEFVAGFFVTKLEAGRWDQLSAKAIAFAQNLVWPGGRPLTAEEIDNIRTPRGGWSG